MRKLTVYTCVTGSIADDMEVMFDSRPDPDPRVEYVYFTDRIEPQLVKTTRGTVPWRVRRPLWEHPTSGRRTARYHKTLSHVVLPKAEATMWLDGAFQIKEGVCPFTLASTFLEHHPIAAFNHPDRTCIYQEFEACVRLKKDLPEVMQAQVDRYREAGYPPYNGLVETACVCRDNSPETRSFNTAWWNEIANGSLRDQLSFNYVAWQQGVEYVHLLGRRDKSPYFTFHPHK